jgi:hypothetical protein
MDDIQSVADEEYRLPCAEALLAGTLALMTGHAQACCSNQRHLMAKKIGTNLSQLAEHPQLLPQFRAMLWNLGKHWQALMQQSPAVLPAQQDDQRLWHQPAPSVH